MRVLLPVIVVIAEDRSPAAATRPGRVAGDVVGASGGVISGDTDDRLLAGAVERGPRPDVAGDELRTPNSRAGACFERSGTVRLGPSRDGNC